MAKELRLDHTSCFMTGCLINYQGYLQLGLENDVMHILPKSLATLPKIITNYQNAFY